MLRRPRASFFERHEFDEAHGDAFLASEHAEGNDLVFVEAAHQDAIYFQGPQSGAAGGANSGEHVIVSAGHAGNAGEAVGIDGVHGNGDASEAGGFQGLREIGQQVAVGSEGNVEWLIIRIGHGAADALVRRPCHTAPDEGVRGSILRWTKF